MKTLLLELPENFNIDEEEVKMTLAAGLYRKGKLTMGQAAQLVNLSKRTFMELLTQYDTDIINYPPHELENDLSNAKNYSI